MLLINYFPKKNDSKEAAVGSGPFLSLRQLSDNYIHTIYSDGNVTPDIRVLEAVGEGLDAIAFTDHVYGKPSNNNANEPDGNSAFKKAKDYAAMLND